MATQTQAQASQAQAEAPPETLEDLLLTVADGSEVSDPSKFGALVEEGSALLKKALSAFRAATTVYKQVAANRAAIRRYILFHGGPDWSATSAVYKLHVQAESATITGNDTEKRRINQAIQQHVNRTYLESEIVRYVLDTVNGMPKASEIPWTEAKGDNPSYPATPVNEDLKKAVAAEYTRCGLTVPQKYGGPARGSNGAGPQKADPANPSAAFEAALGGLETLAPKIAANDLRRAVTALCEKVRTMKDGEVPERQAVEAEIRAIGVLCVTTAMHLAGKASEKDAQDYATAKWSKK